MIRTGHDHSAPGPFPVLTHPEITPQRLDWLAGQRRFEPPHDAVKIRWATFGCVGARKICHLAYAARSVTICAVLYLRSSRQRLARKSMKVRTLTDKCRLAG
jgi:hypothetical protein